MKLEKIDIEGVDDIYALQCVKKEFRKAVNEPWKNVPPWKRFQRKLIGDLAVLSDWKEQAISFPQFEKLEGESNIYSIRHPETTKNVRVLYVIEDGFVILLTAFLEKNDGDYKKAIKIAKSRLQELKS